MDPRSSAFCYDGKTCFNIVQASQRRSVLANQLSFYDTYQGAAFYYVFRYAMSRLEFADDQDRAGRKAAAAAIMRRLDSRADADQDKNLINGRRQRKEDLVLNQYEQRIALDVVASEDIPVKFDGMSMVLQLSYLD